MGRRRRVRRASVAFSAIVGLLSPFLAWRFLVVPAVGLALGAMWLVLRRSVDDESPRSYGRWAALAACTVSAVGAFVPGMGRLAGEP